MNKIDKREVMKDAHRRYRRSVRDDRGLSFGECLSRAWQAAKFRRDVFSTRPDRHIIDRPFPQQIAV